MGQQAMGGQGAGGGSAPGKDTYMRNPPGGTIPHAQAMPPGYGSMQAQDGGGGGGNPFAALLQQMQMQHGGQAPGTGSMGTGMQQGGMDPRAAMMGAGQMGGRGMPGPVGLGATQMAPRGAPGAGGDPRGLGGVQFQPGPGAGPAQQMQSGGAGPQGMPGFMQNPQLRSMMGPAVNVQGMYAGMPGAQQNIASLMQHFGLGAQAPNAQ